MNELVRVQVNDNQEQVVSAREVHERLGIQKDFTDWFKNQANKMGLMEVKHLPLLGGIGLALGLGSLKWIFSSTHAPPRISASCPYAPQ